jgi:radical SAM protein with 4Fe4S-binding SPASM domain
MSFELAKKVIDEAKKNNFLRTIRFSENGEALLNKEFFRIFEYCQEMLPACNSILYTNMALLEKSTGLRLLNSNLSELHFNIDGASAATYEAAKNLNFLTFKKNLHDFIETRKKLRKKCKVHIYVLTARKYLSKVENIHISLPDDTMKIIEYWEPFLEKSDTISIVDKPYKWALREKKRIPKTTPCRKLSKVVRECLIGPNGDVYLCCLDYQQKCVIGNIKDNSIKEIWSSTRRKTLLKLLGDFRFQEIGEPCAFCLD